MLRVGRCSGKYIEVVVSATGQECSVVFESYVGEADGVVTFLVVSAGSVIIPIEYKGFGVIVSTVCLSAGHSGGG